MSTGASEMKINRRCLVCDTSHFTTLYDDTLLKCENCQFVIANMEVGSEKLQEIYSENYFKGEEYLDYLNDKNIIQNNFEKRLKIIQKSIPEKSISNIMEIGCAYGFFGELIPKYFPSAKYTGLDIVPEAINFAKSALNLNVYQEDFLDFKVNEKYSDIFLWDVIEHLSRPDLVLEKAHRCLTSSGRIVLTTGDISALLPRWQKENWRMIHPPTHLHYFSATTIRKLLEAKGFQIIDLRYPAIHRSVRQIFYSLFLLEKKPNSWKEKLLESIPERWSVPINTFDIMFIIAKRI